MRIVIEDKRFGEQRIFANFSLALADGEFLAIAGPSGCGKTTLLRLIAGLDLQADMRISDSPRRIGYVFQEPRLIPWRTVEENLRLVCGEGAAAVDRAERALKSVELWDERDLYPDALSLGMKRRVELARALVVAPDLLILDEPFVSLDRAAAEGLRRVLLSAWQEKKPKVIMVSHDLDEGLQLADRMILLSRQPATITKELHLDRPRDRRDATWTADYLSQLE